MTTVNDSSQKRKSGKHILIGLLLLIGFVIGWFGIVRLISPWTVVKTITLAQNSEVFPGGPFDGTLRVGCYNIAHGRGGNLGATDWDGGNRATKIERLKQIAHLLQTARLDIVVLNEVDFSSIWSGHVDQARIIAREAGYPYLVEQRNLDMAVPFINVRFGNAILSKYPIADTSFLDYPNPSELIEIFSGGYKEGVIGTILLPDSSSIQVVAVHLCVSSESIRVASARMILEAQRQSSLPFIVMGDFNAAPQGYPVHHTDEEGNNAIEVLFDSKQLSTLPQRLPVNPQDFTFPSEKPDRVIDWIFVSSPWQLREKTVLSTDLSDHLPVVAQLTKERQPL